MARRRGRKKSIFGFRMSQSTWNMIQLGAIGYLGWWIFVKPKIPASAVTVSLPQQSNIRDS